jgi:3-oxoacyl-[acyl-carrier-protein] synthase III
VLKGIQNGINLPVDSVLPSFAALRDYGNTSCSTTWYSMAYMETCGKITKGQTVMQVRGMVGGFMPEYKQAGPYDARAGCVTVLVARNQR